jgi:putative membrane protein
VSGAAVNESLGATLAAVNASLNGTAAVLLLCGWLAVRSGRRRLHGWLMGSAFVVSTVFLVSYLVRVYISRTHHYPGSSGWRLVYLAVLSSHMLLAAATPPLAIRTLYLALRRRFDEHRRLVRFTLPVWMYVSVTGVAVYLLLYHPPG